MAGWILGIILLLCVFWQLIQGIQSHYLLRTVNNALSSMDDSRRVASSLPQRDKNGLYGYWYKMYLSDDNFFVFSVIHNGIMIPLGAIVNSDNKVNEIIPLSAHAVQIFDKLPEAVLKIYITKIEKNIRGAQ